MGQKHYVYSARTTEKGLALLNKTKGTTSWDTFINEAVAAHYKLSLDIINLPPSKFIEERAAKKAAKDSAKAKKLLDKAMAKTNKKAVEVDKAAKANKKAAAKPVEKKGTGKKAPAETVVEEVKTVLNPGDVKQVGDTIIAASATNTKPIVSVDKVTKKKGSKTNKS